MDNRCSAVIAMLLVLGLALAGCRTLPPDLKPDTQPDVFNPPPANLTNDNSYPKQALADPDNQKRNGLDPGKLPPMGGGASMGGPANFGGPGVR